MTDQTPTWLRLLLGKRLESFAPAVGPFLRRDSDVRRLGLLSAAHAGGSLVDAFLLRAAITSGPAGIIFVGLWFGHRALQERKIAPQLRETAGSIGNHGTAELTRRIGVAAIGQRPPLRNSAEDTGASVSRDVAAVATGWKYHVPWLAIDVLTALGAIAGTVIVAGSAAVGGFLAIGLLGACAHTSWKSYGAARSALHHEEERHTRTARTQQRLLELLRLPSWDLFRRTGQQRFAADRLDVAAQEEAVAAQAADGERLRAGVWSTLMSTAMIGITVAWGLLSGNPLLAVPAAILVNQAMSAAARIPDNVLGLIPAMEATRRISGFLSRPSRVAERCDAVHLPGMRHGLEIDSVSHAFEDGTPALRDVSLRINTGDVVALVGTNGSGKTTLLSLLQRLSDPTVGAVRIDGTDLRFCTLDSVDRTFSYAPQAPYVLPTSVRENLLLARHDATDHELVSACRVTGFDSWLAGRGRSLDSAVSSESLSGGEMQRLEITRALLRRAPVLLLDEPTAAMDSGGKEVIAQILQRARSCGQTVILATHDETLVASATTVVTLHRGELIDCGPPMRSTAPTDRTTAARDTERNQNHDPDLSFGRSL